AALAALDRSEPLLTGADDATRAGWHLQKGRAYLRAGDYDAAENYARRALDEGAGELDEGAVEPTSSSPLQFPSGSAPFAAEARAQASIEALAAERDSLSAAARAQLFALESESAVLSGDLASALALCRSCADAYTSIGRAVDAAEALLERVLVAVRGPGANTAE